MAKAKHVRKTAVVASKPLLSACLIVRDEEATVGRALASLAGVADEVIVVDTGSTDRTVEIAAASGASVVHFAWCDDFAAARNESLRHARGKWIVYVDADEELIEDHPGALRALCARRPGSWDGALLTIHNPVDENGLNEVVGRQCRLFRVAPGVRFEGRIHEQLRWPAGEPNLQPADAHGISILHHGYKDHADLLKRKGERNRRLLELTLAEQPAEPAHHFFLGRQFAWERRFEEALPPLLKAIVLWLSGGRAADGYVPSMFSTAALAALQAGKPETVVEIEASAPPDVISAELLFTAGVAYARLGRTAEAIGRLNRAWQDKTLATASGSDPSAATWRPLLALAEIQLSLGRTRDARAAIERALALAPDQPELLSMRQRLTVATAPLVSACMIVRNEADNLRRWLPRIREAVDELIVVDTGSDDGSFELAAELGAEVRRFAWCNDFAAARNASLADARGQWIVWLDADDELLLDSPDGLRELCRGLPADTHGCLLPVNSAASADGAAGPSMRQWRLFRNGLGLRFRGRVHEQLSAPAELGPLTLVDATNVEVRHWGYALGADVLARKLQRNRELLEMSIAEEPGEPMHRYSLGKQYVWTQDYAAALPELESALDLWRTSGKPLYGFVAPLFAVSACTVLNLGHNQRALDLEAECPADAISSDLLYYTGIACQRLGRNADAISRLMRAATDPAVRRATETDAATATWRPRMLLGQIHVSEGRREEAYRWVMEAIELLPEGHPHVLLSGARLAKSMGHPEDAVRITKRLLGGNCPEALQSQARQLLEQLAAVTVA